MVATALRLKMVFGACTQGSSFLATLGFGPESRWDSQKAGLFPYNSRRDLFGNIGERTIMQDLHFFQGDEAAAKHGF